MNTLQNDVQQFNQLHPHRKLATFGIILFVFVLSVVIGVYYSKKQSAQTDTTTTQSESNSTTSLALAPSAEMTKVGETFTVSVLLNGQPVQATDIVITFDKTMFKASNILNGKVFDNLIRQDITPGMISVTGAVQATANPEMKTGEVFTFTMEALKKGTSELKFDKNLTITAKNGVNTLSNAQNISIQVD